MTYLECLIKTAQHNLNPFNLWWGDLWEEFTALMYSILLILTRVVCVALFPITFPLIAWYFYHQHKKYH